MKTTSLLLAIIDEVFKNRFYRSSCLFVLFVLLSHQSFSQFPCNDYTEPTIFCRDLHTAFMPGVCMVEVWAKDLISKASDNHTKEEDLIISFDPEGTVFSIELFSENGSVQTVGVYVTDECGNQALCFVDIFINDNEGDCPEACPIDVSPWCGYSVITCSAETCDDQVAAIIDMRFTSQAPKGDNWSDPYTPNVDPVPFIKPDAWQRGSIGMVYGIAVKPQTGKIFFAASDVYAYDFQQFVTVGFPPPTCTGSGGSAGIYISSFDDPETIIPMVKTSSTYLEANQVIGNNLIPNSGNFDGNEMACTPDVFCETPEEAAQIIADTTIGNGIGNIAYDPKSNHLVASNLEDGKIYSINCDNGRITDVFDPFDAYDHSVDGDGLVDPANRIWAVQVNTCESTSRVYFARETANATPDSLDQEDKEIYSVALNSGGGFTGTEQLEFIIDRGDQVKITDIAFNSECSKVLLAERGLTHSAEVYEYMNMNGNWVFNKQIFAGIYDPVGGNMPVGNSAAGGVSYGSKEIDGVQDAECDSIIWITTNCGEIPLDDRRCAIYGAEGVSSEGNDTLTNRFTDIYIDFNAEFTGNPTNFKSNIGEIEIFACCCIEEEGRNAIQMAMVAGKIKTPERQILKDAEVSIESTSMLNARMTDDNGQYAFGNLDMYSDYTLTPKKDGNPIDGLSTLDLLMIQNHLLGIRKFDSPYQLIAADIDRSTTITTKDLVELRRLLLGVYSDFQTNSTWNFVPESYDFEDPSEPFPFVQHIEINDLSNDKMNNNFVAMKTGDVDGSHIANQYHADTRSLETVEIGIREKSQDGKTFVVFEATETMAFRGFQFTIEVPAGTRLIGTLPGKTGMTEGNVYADKDFMNVSWNSSFTIEAEAGEELFSLEIDKAPNTTIALSSRQLTAEIYDLDYAVASIKGTPIIDQRVTNEMMIAPNPFRGETNIHFTLDKAQTIDMEFYGADGRLAHRITRHMQKGNQSIQVDREDLGEGMNGVIMVRLRADNKVYNKKMILVK